MLIPTAIRDGDILRGWFRMLVQQDASNKGHDEQEAEAKYDAYCNDISRAHRT